MKDGETKVIHLREISAPTNEPDENIVALLEEHLAAAKAGNIVGIAIASAHRDGDTGTAYACQPGIWGRLIGAAQYQVHRLCLGFDDE